MPRSPLKHATLSPQRSERIRPAVGQEYVEVLELKTSLFEESAVNVEDTKVEDQLSELPRVAGVRLRGRHPSRVERGVRIAKRTSTPQDLESGDLRDIRSQHVASQIGSPDTRVKELQRKVEALTATNQELAKSHAHVKEVMNASKQFKFQLTGKSNIIKKMRERIASLERERDKRMQSGSKPGLTYLKTGGAFTSASRERGEEKKRMLRENSKLKEKIQQLQNNDKSNNSKIIELEQQLFEIQRQLKKAERNVSEIEAACSKLRDKHKDEMAALKEKSEESKRAVEDELGKVQMQLKTSRRLSEDIISQKAVLVEEAKEKLSAMQRQCKEAQARAEELESEKIQLAKEARATEAKLQEQLDNALAKAFAAESETKRQNKEILCLQEKNSKARSLAQQEEYEKLKVQSEESAKQAKGYDALKRQSEEAAMELKKQLEEALSRADAAKSKAKRKQRKLEQQKASMDAIRASNHQLSNDLHLAQEKAEEAKQLLQREAAYSQNLLQQISETQQAVQSLEADVQEQREKNAIEKAAHKKILLNVQAEAKAKTDELLHQMQTWRNMLAGLQASRQREQRRQPPPLEVGPLATSNSSERSPTEAEEVEHVASSETQFTGRRPP
eukprot:g57635.t1